MNRFNQRLQLRLQNPEFAEGYREMTAEQQLLHAQEQIRLKQQISKEALATQMGRKPETVFCLLTSDGSNSTLNTLIELLSAMRITADITLRQSQEGDEPLKVTTELP